MLVVFSRALLDGVIYWEGDTLAYYLPVLETYRAGLRRLDLPLWTPHIFGGQPLFAEGEGGMLYPLNLLLAAALPTEAAFVWGLVIRFGLAGTFTFWFARVLGLEHLPSLVAAYVFAFSSFMVGQIHHSNVGDSAIWLPAVLGCAEQAIRGERLARGGWTALGGLALGFAMLGVHVQPVLMTIMLLIIWCVFRVATGTPCTASGKSVREARALTRALPTLLIAPGIVLVGVGVAAVQLLPLVELSRLASRGEGGLTYQSATNFAPGLIDVVTLLFPTFFQGPDNHWWTLWLQWETTLYVGIVPVVLALVAVLFRRTPETWLFAGVCSASLLLALGDSSPINMYWLLWHLPGLSFLRAPGRFSYLLTFGAALLAAYGFQWLASLAAHSPGASSTRPAADRKWSIWRSPFAQLRVLAVGLVGFLLVLAGALVLARRLVIEKPDETAALIRERYLTLPHDPAITIDAASVVRSLTITLDIGWFPTAFSLLLLGGVAVVLATWSASCRRPRLLHGALAGLVAVDLLVFALRFHQVGPYDALTGVQGAARFLSQQAGLFRYYSLGQPPPGVEPNRLLPLGRSDAGGYSSLILARVDDYLKRVPLDRSGNLLDLMGVRYLLLAGQRQDLPEYRGVRYDVQHPLAAGHSSDPGSTLTARADGARAVELRLVGFMRNARHIPQETEIASVEVRDDRGQTRRYSLRAGVDLSDEGLELPLLTPVGHNAAEVAFSRPSPTAEGFPSQTSGYFARIPFGPETVIDDVTVRFVSREGEIEILGAALVDGAGGTHQLAAQATVLPLASDPSHYRPVYEDRNSYVAENTQPAPRAFMVYAAAPAPGGRASLGVLTDAAFQPRRQVLLDEPVPTDLPSAAPRDATADIATYEDRRVLVGVHTPSSGLLVLADANYPGWRAYVDGSETPILTADSIFRAVRVPAGDHLVEFTYEPFTFRLGAAISLGTLALLACVGVNVWRQSRRAHRHQANAALRRHLTEPKGFA